MQKTRVFHFAIILAIVAAAIVGAARLPGLAHPSIDIVASNWKFTPNTISVPLGEPTTLRLTSSEGVHGIKSDELGIRDTMIVPNKFIDVSFTPAKAGTYAVRCSVICGAGHPNMILTIKVEK